MYHLDNLSVRLAAWTVSVSWIEWGLLYTNVGIWRKAKEDEQSGPKTKNIKQ